MLELSRKSFELDEFNLRIAELEEKAEQQEADEKAAAHMHSPPTAIADSDLLSATFPLHQLRRSHLNPRPPTPVSGLPLLIRVSSAAMRAAWNSGCSAFAIVSAFW